LILSRFQIKDRYEPNPTSSEKISDRRESLPLWKVSSQAFHIYVVRQEARLTQNAFPNPAMLLMSGFLKMLDSLPGVNERNSVLQGDHLPRKRVMSPFKSL